VTADLVEQAEHRAGLASLCGWLLLAEPGPELAEHVRAVPALAALADPGLAVDYERIFLRAVAPLESIFRSHDGRPGGPIAQDVVAAYDELGFDEHASDQWRVGGADHLGLELRCYAHLCMTEAAAWREDRGDEAVAAVERERRFLAEHLASWAGVALSALLEAGAESPYRLLIEAVSEFLEGEVERLRPAPLLAGMPVAAATELPERFGPARLARHLLAPSSSGIWLSAHEIGRAAAALGFPFRPVDGRSVLRRLLEAAMDAGELHELASMWTDVAACQAGRYEHLIADQPGAAAIWAAWLANADRTTSLLRELAENGSLHPPSDCVVVLRVSGPSATSAADVLRNAGLTVEELLESERD
jgi:TorA maturation chaperone TorD